MFSIRSIRKRSKRRWFAVRWVAVFSEIKVVPWYG